MEDKGFRAYLRLFWATFTLSAFTFGGGYVIVPLMRKKFVEQCGWLEEEEMLNLTAIAQSSPGPIAVNASILVGYRLKGVAGAVAAVVGTSLPPLLILSVISLFYTAFRENAVVAAVLGGMLAGVSAVVCDVVVGMAAKIIKQKKLLPILIMAAAFIAAQFLNVNLIYIILFCGTLGALVYMRDQKTGKEHI